MRKELDINRKQNEALQRDVERVQQREVLLKEVDARVPAVDTLLAFDTLTYCTVNSRTRSLSNIELTS